MSFITISAGDPNRRSPHGEFMRRGWLGTSAVLALALTSTTAFAQTTQSAPATPSDAEQASDTPEEGLSDIVVTAQRRTETLQRAAIAASAVSGDALTAGSITQPAQLAAIVPALKVTPTGGTNNNVYIRGVGTQAANSFAENAVGVNLDGVYIGRPSGLSGLLYDLERVEVLKGPQGTLYGRNATGGVINIISKKPSFGQIGGMASFEYGNYNTKKAQAALNLPLGRTLALRIAGQYVDRDGYLSDGYDDENGWGARASLAWEPSDAFRVDLTADYAHQGGKGAGSVLQPASSADTVTPAIDERVGGADPRSLAALRSRYPGPYNGGAILPPRQDGYVDSETFGVSAAITGDTGFGTITFIPAYRETKPNFLSYRTGFYALTQEVAKQMSGELRFASPEDRPLQYVVGGYYYFQTQDFTNYLVQGNTVGTLIQGKLNTESYAAFGQLNYSVTDALRLVGGVRYTNEFKSRNGTVGPRAPLALNAPRTPIISDKTFENVSYRASVEFDAGPRSLLYASVATGFKSGGFYTGIGDASYQPEKLTAFTVGAKNRFFDNRVQLNIEGFYWKYRDQQIGYIGPVQTSPGNYVSAGLTSNVGQARMYGVDLDFRWLITPNDNFSAAVQYLNAKYIDFSFLAVSGNGAALPTTCTSTPDSSLPLTAPARLFLLDCSGKQAINAPEWSAVLNYDHTFELGGDYSLVAQVGTKLEASRYLNIEYLPGQRQGAYRKSNASLTLRGPAEQWSISAFIDNIEDRTTVNQAIVRPIVNSIYVGLEPPRTYGLRARVGF